MAIRKTYKKRTYRPKKKNLYRKRAIVRGGKRTNLGKDLFFFKRGSNDNQFAEIVGSNNYSSANGGYKNAFIFQLSQVRNYTEFTSLFDRYKINGVQLKFILRTDVSAQASTSATYPRMWWCKDYDDNAVLNIDEMREHQRYKTAILKPNKPINIFVRPATLAMLYNGVTTGYAPQWGKWLDCSYNMYHYGLKVAIDDFSNTNYRLAIEAKFWLSFKDTR